ncbi:small ribosomal subunit protein uS3m-like [Liolophura sinensis]|uniref:small ribosomal subunit protein uS3m-like n=1 Tax=Liolophura sinensis TaxID=3198878 RepID=UPI003158245B
MSGKLTSGMTCSNHCQLVKKMIISRIPIALTKGCAGIREFSTTGVLMKNRRAGQPKTTINKTLPMTYEQSQPPYKIGVTKSWNSWNTSTLHEEGRQKDTVVEDIFIRKFVTGTWHKLFLSEVIIKRQHNLVILAGLVHQGIAARKMYFLWGYTEEMLAQLLKCPVKLEIQTVKNKEDVIFKYW